jgi:hypothetical protein
MNSQAKLSCDIKSALHLYPNNCSTSKCPSCEEIQLSALASAAPDSSSLKDGTSEKLRVWAIMMALSVS